MNTLFRAVVIAACVCVPRAAVAQTAPSTATPGVVRGVVLDRTDGAPIADVSVQFQESGQVVKTDAAGRFELTGVEPGARTLYVSVVGFILVKRAVTLAPGQTLELAIALSEGTGTYSEEITVTADRFREQERSVPSQQTLGSAEIQNLRSLITNDPMRAIQVLPGVSTGDDFRSEFSVRGNNFSRMNFTFDGIPTSFLLHTVQQVLDGGSIAMVNGDILDGIALLNGSYPQRYGNRLGAELDFTMREGSRDRRQLRVGISGTDASIVAEGPLGGRKAGSWLVSLRKSYLEFLLKQIDEENDFGFGFADAQAKLVYDVSSRSRLELSLIAGRSKLDQTLFPGDIFDVKEGINQAQLANLAWRFMPSASFVTTHRLAFAANQYRNDNAEGRELGSGGGRDLTWRTDVVATLSPAVSIEGGGQLQWQQRDDVRRSMICSTCEPAVYQQFDASALLSGAYGQVRWTPHASISVSPGIRVERWGLTGGTGVSPWIQAEWKLASSLKLRAGAGIHRQFPGFEEVSGFDGNRDLAPERAYHADLGLEGTRGNSRWQVTLYNREERDILRRPLADIRVDAELGFRWVPDAPWSNALAGHARGVELLVQRRSTRGTSGWLSYSYGVNRYRDRVTGERFDGDADQRHTINAYVMYRMTDRTSVGGKLRVGSNFPVPGYWREAGGNHFVGTDRNVLRLPVYSRLDIRANRTFNLRGKRLTLFAEVLNLLGRENMRFASPGIDGRTGRAFGLFDPMIPRIPSLGLLIEF